MPTVKQIYDFINSLAPFCTQESWDNSGLLLGNPDKEVSLVSLALDATNDTVAAAKADCAELMITHHPVIFSPAKKILAGSVIYELLTNGISAISAHTCLDSAEGGVNDTLAAILELEDITPLELDGTDTPLVRVGRLKAPMSGDEFAKYVKAKLGCNLRLADAGNEIKTVAVCGGSLSSLTYELIGKVDAFVTGDLTHHYFIDAAYNGLTAVAAGHFETENPVMSVLKAKLEAKFPEVSFTLINQKNPVKYY